MSEEQITQDEPQIPTKEQILTLIAEQIEVKTAQLQLQELNEKMAKSRAGEYQALQFIAQMTGKGTQQEEEHTLTKEDLDANPDLVSAGYEVGDTVLVPTEISPAKADRKLKKV